MGNVEGADVVGLPLRSALAKDHAWCVGLGRVGPRWRGLLLNVPPQHNLDKIRVLAVVGGEVVSGTFV